MPYPELWILEVCVRGVNLWRPLARFADTKKVHESGFNEQWNCPANGLTGGELCRWLVNMARRGLIEFRLFVDHESVGEFVPTDSRFLHAILLDEFFRQRDMAPRFYHGGFHYVRLTSQGIAHWEAFAQPNWAKYRGDFEGRLEEAGETTWSQTAQSEAFAREVLDHNGSDVFSPATIHWDTARTTIHEPWQPFPGKWLPRGVTITVDVTEYGPRSIPCSDVALNLKSKQHYQRFCEICHWYERGVREHPDRPQPHGD